MSKLAPQKINNIICFDLETSGLDKVNGLHSQKCAVTEFGAIAINAITLQEIIRYDNLVKPYDSSHVYEKEAADLTGINREMCLKDGIPLKQLVEDICSLCNEANIYDSKVARPILVAHNGAFDKQFLQDIFKRANVDMSKYVKGDKDHFGNFQPEILDTIAFAKMIWGDVTDNTTKFNLEACCLRAGIQMSDGHRAMNDVVPLTEFVRYCILKLRSSAGSIEVKDGQVSSHRVKFEW